MTHFEKQEIISEISQILDNYINTPSINKSIEMLTINECCELVTGLSKHTICELVWQGKIGVTRNKISVVFCAKLVATLCILNFWLCAEVIATLS